MQFSEVSLIYVAQAKDEKGSPKALIQERKTKAKEIRSFSLNYYLTTNATTRIMRLSKNIVVPKWMTDDFFFEDKRYQLRYVDYQGLRYAVKNILHYYKSSLRMILDIEELQ